MSSRMTELLVPSPSLVRVLSDLDWNSLNSSTPRKTPRSTSLTQLGLFTELPAIGLELSGIIIVTITLKLKDLTSREFSKIFPKLEQVISFYSTFALTTPPVATLLKNNGTRFMISSRDNNSSSSSIPLIKDSLLETLRRMLTLLDFSLMTIPISCSSNLSPRTSVSMVRELDASQSSAITSRRRTSFFQESSKWLVLSTLLLLFMVLESSTSSSMTLSSPKSGTTNSLSCRTESRK